MSRILIIHTGGTIGMTKTADGYKPDGEYFKKAIFHMDSLKADSIPEWDFTETVPLLDSSQLSVDEWNTIGSLIAQNYPLYDGFVILHGTDTMAYTASALSFMLKGLHKPVILTGSQIPLCETRSDGRDNLITSMMIAGAQKVREVCVYFGGLLLRGNRTMKYSADGMQAFVSPNYPALATAGISIQYNENAFLKHRADHFACRLFENIPIGVIKVFPGIPFELFDALISEEMKGIVIEAFGSGNIPERGLLPILEKAKKNNVIITVCSQCPQSTVDMSTYEAGSILRKAGAVSGKDMTTEAAVTKLYYLFSVYDDIDRIKFNMERDIRGEMIQKEDI